jgi:hypothetical protein
MLLRDSRPIASHVTAQLHGKAVATTTPKRAFRSSERTKRSSAEVVTATMCLAESRLIA